MTCSEPIRRKQPRRPGVSKHFLPLLFLAVSARGAVLVTFTTGAQMSALQAECLHGEARCVLYFEGGRIELPASSIAGIESLPAPEEPREAAPAAPPPQKARRDPRELVTEAALRHGLPPELVHAVAWAESAYQPAAVSPIGAFGIMQLMPSTAAGLGADPHDPEQNVDAGVRFLRQLLLRYRNTPNPVRRALAAYNAGPAAVERYNGLPPFRETLNYVERVIERYWRLARPAQHTTPAP
ncbi:MAG: hypothetical protein KatS3mg004_3093 [Bryobacteraceae bacterium]|nr:MAG: hypothetical protein KatS3mg004_3093 [Bryobacteraceae bacterium]